MDRKVDWVRTEAEAGTPQRSGVSRACQSHAWALCLLGLWGPEGKQKADNPPVSLQRQRVASWSFLQEWGYYFSLIGLSNTKPTDNPLCWAGVALLLSAW